MSYLEKIKNLREIVDLVETRVADAYDIDRELFRSKMNHKLATQARFAVWYILSTKYGYSSHTIAEIYEKDRSTVSYGISRAKDLNMPKEMENLLVDKPVKKL